MENELINQVKGEVTEYGQSLIDSGKLQITGILSRIIGLFLLIFTVVLLVFALLSFGAVAIIDALSNHMPVWAAALIMAGAYALLIGIAVLCRKPLFIHPFIKLMTNEISTEEELALKTLEAEHRTELQRLRIENHVENATRELDFFVHLVRRLRSLLFRKG